MNSGSFKETVSKWKLGERIRKSNVSLLWMLQNLLCSCCQSSLCQQITAPMPPRKRVEKPRKKTAGRILPSRKGARDDQLTSSKLALLETQKSLMRLCNRWPKEFDLLILYNVYITVHFFVMERHLLALASIV